MPELPDIAAYLNALETRIVGQPLERVRLANAFLLRTVQPPIESIEGHTICSLRRIGKRIAIEFDNGIWMVLHLMIAGRLHWRPVGAKLGGRNNLAAFDFPNGSLVLTEAGAKRRASLHLFRNEAEMQSIDPGGLDVFAIDLDDFRAALTVENRSLKRALTDPRILSGIGNAYSDEILHTAQLSPILQTHKLTRRNGSDCSRQPVKHCNSGSTGLKRKPIRAFQRKLRPFGKTWLYTDALSNPVHDAASRYSEFVMPTMKRTTALSVRPEAKCWQTEACPGSLERTGLELWMNWKP